MTGGYKLPERKKYRLAMDLTCDELLVLRMALAEFTRSEGHPPYYYDWARGIFGKTEDLWRKAIDDPEL